MVYKANTYKIELEDKDYYGEEVKFQKVLDATSNAKRLTANPLIVDSLESLYVHFPAEFINKPISGNFRFIRLNNEKQDKLIPINTSTAIQSIPKKNLVAGLYKIKMMWKVEDKEYYFEESYSVKP